MSPQFQKGSVIPLQQPQQKRISMQSDLLTKRLRKFFRTCSSPFRKSKKIYNKTPIRHQNGFSPQKPHIRANKKSLRNIDFSGFSSYAPDRNRTCGLSVRSRTLYPLSYGCLCKGLCDHSPISFFILPFAEKDVKPFPSTKNYSSISTVGRFQISSAYWRIVLSEENLPLFAVFTIAILAHLS